MTAVRCRELSGAGHKAGHPAGDAVGPTYAECWRERLGWGIPAPGVMRRRPMTKLNVAIAGAVLIVLVGGCSEDKTEDAPGPTDYCATLEKTQADFQGFNFLALNDADFDELLG